MQVNTDSIIQKKGAEHSLLYSVLYSDTEDVTHFRDEYMPWNKRSSGNAVTPFRDAQQIGFLRLHENLKADWHPAPRKQFVMVLKGVMEVEAGDGERRTFTPGSVLLVTDTECRGHCTRTLGNREVIIVWVPVP